MPPLLSLPSKIVGTAWHYRPTLSTEQLVLWGVVIFSVFYNVPFWQQAFAGYDPLAVQTWLTFANMFLVMTCLNPALFTRALIERSEGTGCWHCLSGFASSARVAVE